MCMKKLFTIVCLFIASITFAQEVTISGKITNYSGNDSLKLQLFSSQNPVEYSIFVDKEGKFSKTFSNTITTYAKLFFYPDEYILLILSPKEKVKIEANFNKLSEKPNIEGSVQTKLWNTNNQVLLDYNNQAQLKKEQYEKQVDSIEKQKVEYVKNFIKKNPTSLASLAVIEVLDISIYSDFYEFLDSSLMSVHKGNPIVDNFHSEVQKLMFLKEGSIAPDIILNDRNGKQIALSSLRGKVVLIDFWASWCRPCRMEIPNLKNAYSKYNSKGFEVYSVSVDNDRSAWIQALDSEAMPWANVHDAEKTYGTMYNVTSIPNTILIDKEGKIISKNVRGQALEQYLQQIFQ